MLTGQQCIDQLFVSLSGQAHPKIGDLPLINRAGNWLMSIRAWRWSVRVASLDVVPGSDRIYLPEDYHGAVAASGRIFGSMEFTSPDQVLQGRENGSGIGGRGYIGFVTYGETPTGALVPTIEVYPTVPTSGETTAGSIAYTASWAPIAGPTDRAKIPWFVEPLFLSAIDAFARGVHRPMIGTIAARLADVMAGGEWEAAVQADDNLQREFGVIRNGAAESPSYMRWLENSALSVGDPTQVA